MQRPRPSIEMMMPSGLQGVDEAVPSKLSALIGIEDLRFALGQGRVNASKQKYPSSVLDKAQDRIYRLYQSMTADKYMKPVGMGR